MSEKINISKSSDIFIDELKKIPGIELDNNKIDIIRDIFSKRISELLFEQMSLNIQCVNGLIHHINGCLTAPIGVTDFLLYKANLSNDELVMLGIMKEGLDKLKNFSDSFMDSVKLSILNKELVNFREIEIIDFINNFIILFNLEQSCINKGYGIDILKNLSEYDNIRIIGNENELKLCLKILFENALHEVLKYNDLHIDSKNNIHIEVKLKDGFIVFYISNPGFIPEKISSKLFKQFCVESTKSNGHGFGTFVAASIARKHGGDIYIHNTSEEDGTTICLKLPIADSN